MKAASYKSTVSLQRKPLSGKNSFLQSTSNTGEGAQASPPKGKLSKLMSCYKDDSPPFVNYHYGCTPSDVATKPKHMAAAQLQKGWAKVNSESFHTLFSVPLSVHFVPTHLSWSPSAGYSVTF